MLRGLVDNVLSGMKAGFKAILNLEHPFERKKMFIQKGSSKLSATLLALILGASVFMAGQVWAAEMVKDPATGKMVEAPRYGGTITYPTASGIGEHADIWYGTHIGSSIITGVLEKISIPNWALDREVWDMRSAYVQPEHLVGALAESWQVPDDLTYIFYIRQGVRWHDKAPMHGRALTAQDVVYNFHRMLGLGSGFTEAGPQAHDLTGIPFESITAESPRKVVMKLKRPYFTALRLLLDWFVFIYPPEVIQQHGDAKDWRNLVGTGPFMLTDHVEGNSLTYTKNPNYWGYDAKFPENRLPYIDRLRVLELKEEATRLAALRSGKVDFVGSHGDAQIRDIDLIENLQKTNPEIGVHKFFFRSGNSYRFNGQAIVGDNPPFNDIRVRKAMQMAIDLETINATFFKGYASTVPEGVVSKDVTGYAIPFEDWPEDVKKVFDYDPEGARQLLADAGYSDGIKATLVLSERFDTTYTELVIVYWSAIGVDVEIRLMDEASSPTVWGNPDIELVNTALANRGGFYYLPAWVSTAWVGFKDPAYDAIVDSIVTATTVEEQRSRAQEANMYMVKEFWYLWGPEVPMFQARQPWVKGYNGELWLGRQNSYPVFARVWIDQELKKAMGN